LLLGSDEVVAPNAEMVLQLLLFVDRCSRHRQRHHRTVSIDTALSTIISRAFLVQCSHGGAPTPRG